MRVTRVCCLTATPLCVQYPSLTVEQHTFRIFDRVKVTVSLDNSNIQHQKIRMALTEPVVRTDAAGPKKTNFGFRP